MWHQEGFCLMESTDRWKPIQSSSILSKSFAGLWRSKKLHHRPSESRQGARRKHGTFQHEGNSTWAMRNART